MVLVSLAAATICFAGACYPALVGSDTPTGTFDLSRQLINAPGYGGDVLVFKENDRYIWAVHRVYTLNPKEDRLARLRSDQPLLRRAITKGCVNVMPEVYQHLATCCSKDILVIY